MQELDNLVKINKLNLESANSSEFLGMLRAGDTKLKDAYIEGLSEDSQFSLAYGAAMLFLWLPCAGMAIVLTVVTWYFNV